MEPKLREHIEILFASAPKTYQSNELKEEIIRNTIERYHDLVADGKSETEAYNLAVDGIGDVSELINELGGEFKCEPKHTPTYTDDQLESIKSRTSTFKSIAVALYIFCVTPCIFLADTPLVDISPIFMFFIISIATGLLIYSGMTKYIVCEVDSVKASKLRKSAILRATAVGMYISCVTPCILFAETPLATVSPAFMFLLIAVASVMIILSKNNNSYTKIDDTMVENFKEWNGKKKTTSALYKGLVAILWVTASILYIYITIATGVFTICVTWIIFLIAKALQQVMRAIFDYVEAVK